MNKDGRPDIIFRRPHPASPSMMQFGVMLAGNGASFASPVYSDVMATPPPPGNLWETWHVVGDVNGDGVPDIVFRTSSHWKSLLGTVSGTFTATTFSVSAYGKFGGAGDIDADGKLDFVDEDTLYRGLGNGHFTKSDAPWNSELLVCDINGDGKTDVVATSPFGHDLWISNGDGTFAGSRIQSYGEAIAAGDLTGDGKADLIDAFPDYKRMITSVGVGNGTVSNHGFFEATLPGDVPDERSETFQSRFVDLDGDGHNDFVTGASVLYGMGNARFAATTRFRSRVPQLRTVYDVNADGHADLYSWLPGGLVAIITRGAALGAVQASVSLETSPLPEYYGQPIEMSGVVSSSSRIKPQGSVRISRGDWTMSLVDIEQTGRRASLPFGFELGPLQLTASWSGDDNFAPGSASTSFVIGKSPTAIDIELRSGGVYPYGYDRMEMKPNAYPIADSCLAWTTGRIQVKLGNTVIGDLPTYHWNSWQFLRVDPPLPIGTHTLTAEYAGDDHFLPSVSEPFTVTIDKRRPQVKVANVEGPAGAPITLSVAFLNTESLPVTGTVSFTADGVSLGSATIANDSASLTTTFEDWGFYTIEATYSGDTLHKATSGVGYATVEHSTSITEAPFIRATVLDPSKGIVRIDVAPVPGATSYTLYATRGVSNGFRAVETIEHPFFYDSITSAGAYRVTASAGEVESPMSNVAVATTTVFSDVPIVARTTGIRAAHITELQTAIDLVRAEANLQPFTFTPVAAGELIRSAHVMDLRTLSARRSRSGEHR